MSSLYNRGTPINLADVMIAGIGISFLFNASS